MNGFLFVGIYEVTALGARLFFAHGMGWMSGHSQRSIGCVQVLRQVGCVLPLRPRLSLIENIALFQACAIAAARCNP